MSVAHVAVLVLVWSGCAVTVLSCVGLLRTRNVYDALHLLAPVSSLGGPLIAVGLMIQNGWSLTSAQVAVIAVLLLTTGTAATIATARVAHEKERGTPDEGPE